MKIKTIEKINTQPTYDLEIKDAAHYILGNGIITHNSGIRYANSLTVMLGKSKEKEGTEVVGAIIYSKLDKGRLTKENTQIEIKLYYDRGLDKYYGLLELAEKYGIAVKAKKKKEDKEGGFSMGGQTASEKTIYANPEKYFTPEVMAELEIAAGKEFNYGSNIVIPEEVDNVEENPT